MALATEFKHRDLISKHGNKSDPGYLKLHPNSALARAARAAKKPSTAPAKAPASPSKAVKVRSAKEALDLIAQGQKVELRRPRQVVVLLDKLAKVARDAEAKGDKAPDFNLCLVTVKGSSIFCEQSKGIPRIKMPQLSAKHSRTTPGSVANKMTPDDKDEVDLNPAFRKMLEDRGVKVTDEREKASHLMASQNELNGQKVAGISKGYRAGKVKEARLFVSNDNYIVDGHHRWAAIVGVDLADDVEGDLDMPIARIDMGIIELLAEANKFALENGIPPADASNAADKLKKAVRGGVPCRICGRGMKDPESIRLGFGPSHLKQDAPKIKNKVNALLRSKGLTRDQAERLFRDHRDAGTKHKFVGEPRDSVLGRPARIAGVTVPGQVGEKITSINRPASLPEKIKVGDFVGIRHIGLDKRGKVVRVGRVNADVEVPIRNGKEQKIVRNVPIKDLKPDPQQVRLKPPGIGTKLKEAQEALAGQGIVPVAAFKPRAVASLDELRPGDRVMNGDVGREYEVVRNLGGGRFVVRTRMGIAGDEQPVELDVFWKIPFKNNQLVLLGRRATPVARVPGSSGKERDAQGNTIVRGPHGTPPGMPGRARTGEGPNIVVVDLPKSFKDGSALKAFLDMQDDVGRPLFGSGAVLYIEDQGAPSQILIHEAQLRGVNVIVDRFPTDMPLSEKMVQRRERLRQAQDQMRRLGGRFHAVGFRPDQQNAEFGEPGNIIRRHLRAGATREALIIVPGFRGGTDDENAFGIGGSQLGRAATVAGQGAFGPDADRPGKYGKPKGYWTGHEASPEALAAAEAHFKAGGGVFDAPLEDGIMAFIMKPTGQANHNQGGFGIRQDQTHGGQGRNYQATQPAYRAAHPTVFVVSKGPGGTSPKYWVTDNRTGKRMLFKGPNGIHKYDTLNEVVSFRLLEAAGIRSPRTEFVNERGGAGPRWIAMENISEFPGAMRMAEDNLGAEELSADPQSMMTLNVFDYLIDNTDRHGANWMWYLDDKGVKHVVVIDNGGGFQSRHAPGASYTDEYRGGRGAGNISLMVRAYKKDRDRIERDYDDLLARLEAVNVDGVLASVGGGKLNPDQEEHMRMIRETVTRRIEHLRKNRDKIIDWWMTR